MITRIGPHLLWGGFLVLLAGCLAVDAHVHRRPREGELGDAVRWTAVWAGLAVACAAAVWLVGGGRSGLEFAAAYTVEWSLSADNVLVFAALLAGLAVPARRRYAVLLYGSLGAVVLRLAFILAGWALLRRFDWLSYVLGAILLVTAGRLLREPDAGRPPARRGPGPLPALLGRLSVPPLALTAAAIAAADLAFATDSIPAVLGVTRDPFIAFASNAMAVAGLRSAYFVLEAAVLRLRCLRPALVALLALVGLKMLADPLIPGGVPAALSLTAIGAVLAAAGLAGWLRPIRSHRTSEPARRYSALEERVPETTTGKEGPLKFTWFNLMPWPHLPDDFREKHRSVWVDIPNTLYDPVRGHAVYHEYMDQLEYADSLGFDGIAVNEHHQNGYGLMPSPNIIAAGLARRTSRAAICVIGNSIALYNPPIRVAEEFAMLDVISGGRLVAGFPVGTPMDTNFCYGQIPALTRDKYREAHDLIMRAWAAEEPFVFDGKYNQLRWVNCWPKPIQKPHPPIYVPGGGSVETYDFCLDHDYNYSYLSFGGYKAGRMLLDQYWERAAARGKDDSPYRAAFAQIIAVADTDAEAEKLYAEHILYFYNRCLRVYPGFADPPGYRTVKTIRQGTLTLLRRENQQLFQNVTWKDLVERGMIIAGSPETVRQRMEELIKTLRVGHVFCLLHNGNQPDEKTRHSTRLFAERVMPHLRSLWPEWAHDERWWIHPIENRVRPEETVGVPR